MQKNLYFRTVVRRKNVILEGIFDFSLAFCTYFRLLQEVFIRKNFGKRYFNMSIALMVGIILFCIPTASDFVYSLLTPKNFYYGDIPNQSDSKFWQHYATWYIFLAAYVIFAFLRWRETCIPGIFSRYSLSEGDILPFFQKIRIFGRRLTLRVTVIYVEPGLFFLAGLILQRLHQKIGVLLEVSSIMSALSYAGAYRKGDDYVWDILDQAQMNNAVEEAFTNQNDHFNNKSGVRFYAERPTSEELRKDIGDSMIEKEPVSYAV